jgi:hypothetical protein
MHIIISLQRIYTCGFYNLIILTLNYVPNLKIELKFNDTSSYLSLESAVRAAPYLKRLVSGFPPRRPGFAPGSGQAGFVVVKVVLKQVFSEHFGFPCQNRSFHQLLHHHNHPGQTRTGLATSWSPVQGVLPTVLDLVTERKRRFMEATKAQNWAVEPQEEVPSYPDVMNMNCKLIVMYSYHVKIFEYYKCI